MLSWCNTQTSGGSFFFSILQFRVTNYDSGWMTVFTSVVIFKIRFRQTACGQKTEQHFCSGSSKKNDRKLYFGSGGWI